MSSIVSQGIDLALLGMGTVFIFLTLLVLATITMSKLVLMATRPTQDLSDGKKMAAIAAAIHQHRTNNKLD